MLKESDNQQWGAMIKFILYILLGAAFAVVGVLRPSEMAEYDYLIGFAVGYVVAFIADLAVETLRE